ncbi:hypothetical protein HER32_02565 [Hymenobacter sp. BT18]|uniref:hypothetical protein n=1 Tax=Hymenobacter sp. BT18 TaxID=2835648 RepID=UPI00143E7DA9|nr:hypothetical protein [Hymenobacter sp. BT18]QIX60129.1 hypothetical protein HER32_02565 [Hymenobacter sp. BT18]
MQLPSHRLRQHSKRVLAASALLTGLMEQPAVGQAELAPWGNLLGMRQQGHLLEFETSLRVVAPNWSRIAATAKEAQRPRYFRQAGKQVVTTMVDSVAFTETVEDEQPGQATLMVTLQAQANRDLQGTYLTLALPRNQYSAGKVELLDAAGKAVAQHPFSGQWAEQPVLTSQVRITAPGRQVEINLPEPAPVLLKAVSPDAKTFQLYLPLQLGGLRKGQETQKTFRLKSSGEIDTTPIQLTVNPSLPGRPFEGFGGNFRLQNPTGDPQVIDYSLKNLRVAWGRVEMPWQLWQPQPNTDPAALAKQGQLHPHVKASMEMAQRLSKLGMPVIVTAWSAPAWAISGPPASGNGPGPDGVWGNPLNPTAMAASYKSIADYLVYLKEQYGVEAVMFSFNESDLGINVRQTGQEHAELIKGLGAYFVSRGLKTKLLLGDNSDATTYEFIYPAMQDAAARPYIGAVSFHSWRGWDTPTLQKWAEAATQLQLPLIVGEGSIDAQAWGYPAVFEEESYALEEINLYTRLLNICQPATILQWQLTADYSPLAGGGIFGNKAPLHPTQRFWNLKQLAATPSGLAALPISTSQANVSAAALGNSATGQYAFHLVNNGATREVTVTGLPGNAKKLYSYTTDRQRQVQKGKRVKVSKNGEARFTLDARSYTTLTTNKLQ